VLATPKRPKKVLHFVRQKDVDSRCCAKCYVIVKRTYVMPEAGNPVSVR